MYSYSSASGRKTQSELITGFAGSLRGIDVIAPLSGYVTILIYDSNTSDVTNKTVVAEVRCDAGFQSCNHEFLVPVAVNSGIYAVMQESGGTGSSYIVRYALG